MRGREPTAFADQGSIKTAFGTDRRQRRHALNRVAYRKPIRLYAPNSCTLPTPPRMSVVTDPLFYLLAIPAITLLGLGKGGFSGVGMMSTPLLALVIPPLQAAAIVQPILIVQDAISAFVYRREYFAWNLKVLLAGGTSASARPGSSPPI